MANERTIQHGVRIAAVRDSSPALASRHANRSSPRPAVLFAGTCVVASVSTAVVQHRRPCEPSVFSGSPNVALSP